MDQVREQLRNARSIAVLTGAGVSAESGIPTFRGSGGVWRNLRAEDLATPQGFARDPALVWEWYDSRRQQIAAAQPNAGHRALAHLEARSSRFTLITQNVDDLHERGGSRNVLHVHGSIWEVRCLGCGEETVDMRVPLPQIPPRCACGALLRPGVVWFGEALPQDVWRSAEQAATSSEIFLVAGTSAVVYPAAGLVELARSSGAKVIEINVDATHASRTSGHFLQGRFGELLPQLIS